MHLKQYFREDIRNHLAAVTVAVLSASIAHGGGNLEYVRGCLDLARAQALNYGIDWTGLSLISKIT